MTRRTYHVGIYVKMFPYKETGKYQIRYKTENSKEWFDYGKPMKKGTATKLVSKAEYHGNEIYDFLNRKFVLWRFLK